MYSFSDCCFFYFKHGYLQIESLPTAVFGHLTNLTFLELTSNRIKAIEYRDFIALGNLRSLFLGQNTITRISNKTFVGKLNRFF